MVLHREMLWGESVKQRRFELTWKLRHGKKPENCWLLLLPDESSRNLLDLLDARDAFYLKYRLSDNLVVGVAGNKAEAMELTRSLVDTVYRQTGAFDVRSYFQG